MTTAEARDDLLAMIGIEDPAHASESVLKRITSDINLVLQKIWTMASPWWSAGKSGGVLKGPQPLSGLTLTNGSPNILGDYETGRLIITNATFGTKVNGTYSRIANINAEPAWQNAEGTTLSFNAYRAPALPSDPGSPAYWAIVEPATGFSSPTTRYYTVNNSAQKPPLSGWLTWGGTSGLSFNAGPTGHTAPTIVKEIASVFSSQFLGQTLRLGNDPFDNELASFNETTRVATLVRPYAGDTTTAGTGTLFTDTVILPDAVMSVIPPVLIHGEHELKPLRSQRDVMLFSDAYNFHSYADTTVGPGSTVIAENRDVDVPVGFYIENYRRASGKTTLRMRVSPLPDKEYALRYDVRLGAPEITALNTSTEIPVPQNYAHSVFLPILRYQFSTWRHVNLGNQGNEYKTHYDEAWQILAKLKPQPVSIGRVRIVY
jgi:hypothetical protein